MHHNFKKQFGQNFLKSKQTIDKLISSLGIKPGDSVIEVGPGDGRVTEALLSTSAQVTAVEIDRDLMPLLEEKFASNEDLQLINQSILDFVPPKGKYKVVGSLPYNLSKKIIRKFIEEENKPEIMSFIIQKEVAQDYAANAPRGTFLSNFADIFYEVKYIGKVKKEYFVPKPRVDGGILQFTLKLEPEINPKDYEKFSKFLKNCFRQPRKKLSKVLKSIYKEKDWNTIFESTTIEPNARAANLTLEEFIEISSNFTSLSPITK